MNRFEWKRKLFTIIEMTERLKHQLIRKIRQPNTAADVIIRRRYRYILSEIYLLKTLLCKIIQTDCSHFKCIQGNLKV